MQTQVLYLFVSVFLTIGAKACWSSTSPVSETMPDINALVGKTLDEASNILENGNIIYKGKFFLNIYFIIIAHQLI